MKDFKLNDSTLEMIAVILNNMAIVDKSNTADTVLDKLASSMEKAIDSEEEFKTRMVDEIIELASRLEKLVEFLVSKDGLEMDRNAHELMAGQCEAMSFYIATLSSRLIYIS